MAQPCWTRATSKHAAEQDVSFPSDIENAFDLLDEPPEVQDSRNASQLRIAKGRVQFEAVSFSYDSERPILEDVSIDIPAGQTIAIVHHNIVTLDH